MPKETFPDARGAWTYATEWEACSAVVDALRWTTVMPSPAEMTAARRRLKRAGFALEPEAEKVALVRDIRRMVPLLAIEHPELASEVGRAMDMVEAEPVGYLPR